MNRNFIRYNWVLILMCMFSSPLPALQPEQINYQGRLADAAGLLNTNTVMTFRLWNALTMGNELYGETQQVSIVDGLYSVQIGASNAVPGSLFQVFTNEMVFLEVTLGTNVLTPRERIVSVGYAIHASMAGYAESAGTASNAVYASSAGSVTGTVVLGAPPNPTPQAGTIRWTGTSFEGYNGSAWVPFTTGPTPLLSPEFVLVGNPANANDPLTGRGAVPYSFHIGKYEVSCSEYTVFLNAVDPDGSDPLDLHSPFSGGVTNNNALPEGARYVVNPGWEDKPMGRLSFYSAARFCNWLHNGAQFGGDTETGAYTLSLGTSLTRNPGAACFLPTDNEWYKAAYHQPAGQGGDADDYWLFPTKSNTAPTGESPPGGSNSANITNAVGAFIDQGAYINSPGPYGTFNQMGNVLEYTETKGGFGRYTRGTSYYGFFLSGVSTGQVQSVTEGEGYLYPDHGFRVAKPF